MDILKIIALSLSSFIVLFILTKLMGNREMSQLSMFDYITSITIGSIAAEMATSLENDFTEPLVAMIIYAIGAIAISILGNHSIKARRIISSPTLILYDNSKIYFKNLKKAKMDINEFLMQCRTNGYFNLSDIQTAILEPNGKISFIPNSLKRPATPEDLSLNAKQEFLVTNIIIDGKVLEENLKNTGNNLKWLHDNLEKQNAGRIENIILATCDKDNNLSVYKKISNLDNSHDMFE